MNELDIKIHDLFLNLVNSETKYIVRVDYKSHNINYRINGKDVILSAFTKSEKDKYVENSFSSVSTLYKRERWLDWSWEILHCDSTMGLEFVITINSKQYRVYGLSRIEYARALDSLDKAIKDWEEDQISEVFAALADEIF